jgi:hypothetical protein
LHTRRPAGTNKLGVSSFRTTHLPRSTVGCDTTRVKPSATVPISTAPYRFIPLSGSSVTLLPSAAGSSKHRLPAPASESWSSARGPADCQPPTIWPASATRSRSATRAPCPAG